MGVYVSSHKNKNKNKKLFNTLRTEIARGDDKQRERGERKRQREF
jgi:hypothetical protein